MRLHHKEVSLSLPLLKIYLFVSRRPRRFGFCKGVAELVLCGVGTFFSFPTGIPPMLLRTPLARPFCLLLRSQPLVEAFFVLPMFVVRTQAKGMKAAENGFFLPGNPARMKRRPENLSQQE
jgi:hypothetical protein